MQPSDVDRPAELNMLATLAEYERELIVERVNAGMAAALLTVRNALVRAARTRSFGSRRSSL